MKVKKLTWLSLALSLSLILSYLETLISLPFSVVGMKLGLANMVVLVVLYTTGVKDAALVSASRVCLSALLFGSWLSLAYAAAGAVCSFLSMWVLKKGKFSPWAVSMVGGVVHNIAQISVASLLFRQSAVFSLLPPLLVAGVTTGLFVGIVASLFLHYIQKTELQKHLS
ncbi:MAG: Gx transporter family protein [Clostridia bacterium]|nr:Gx transporter family protein [Clostridia bacterium]